jgi:hypothetical protein
MGRDFVLELNAHVAAFVLFHLPPMVFFFFAVWTYYFLGKAHRLIRSAFHQAV